MADLSINWLDLRQATEHSVTADHTQAQVAMFDANQGHWRSSFNLNPGYCDEYPDFAGFEKARTHTVGIFQSPSTTMIDIRKQDIRYQAPTRPYQGKPDMPRIAFNAMIITTSVTLAACTAESPDGSARAGADASVVNNRVVEASCGQCQLGLPGTGCDLAVAYDGKAHYVDGSHIDDHGDAHAPNGMCNAVLKARVSGTLVDNRFQATEFVIITGDES